MDSRISSSLSKQLTGIDVYELAESINRDFEKLVEKFGNEPFDSIVRKVISALETLEALAKHNDSDSAEISELQKTIEHFEQEKQQRLRDKETLEKDIIELEDNYKKEIDDLRKVIRNLQTDNKNMREQISKSPSKGNELIDSSADRDASDEQTQELVDLRKTTQTQKERIKELQKELGYCDEVGTLRDSIEGLIHQNKELLLKNGSLQQETIQDLQDKLKEAIDEVELLRYENSQLQREVKNANERSTKSTEKITQELNGKESEMNFLQRRLDDYVKQLAANESLENRVKFLDQQVSNQQGIQSELSGDLEKAVNRANIAERDVQKLKESLDKAASVIEEYSTASENHCSVAELLQVRHELGRAQAENQLLLNKMDQFKHEATQEQRLITTHWYNAHSELLRMRHGLGNSPSSSPSDQQNQRIMQSSTDSGHSSSTPAATIKNNNRSFLRRQFDTSTTFTFRLEVLTIFRWMPSIFVFFTMALLFCWCTALSIDVNFDYL